MTDKLKQLEKFAHEVRRAASKTGIHDAYQVHVTLPHDFWNESLSEIMRAEYREDVYHPQQNEDKFNYAGVSFYNQRGLPPWMKKS